jgi:hypothetical protein
VKVNIGDISESEIDLVMSAIRLSVLEEDKGRGVLVTCIDGMRTWQMNSEDTWITIPGEHHSFEGSYQIPGRLILSAYTLNSAGGTCNLSIDHDSATIRSSNGGEIQMAVCAKTPEFKTFSEDPNVTAMVQFRDFQRICSVLAEMPIDIEDFMSFFSQPPLGHVTIDKKGITLRRSWSYVGCPDTVVKQPAQTTGTGTFSLSHLLLDNMMNRLFINSDPELTMSFNSETGQYLQIQCDQFSINFDRKLSGAEIYFPQVIEYLEEKKISHLVHDNGLIAANYKDVNVRIQLFDGTEPVIRATSTVLHNVTQNVKLLREINRLNTTRVGVRVWCDNNMIVVGAEMRCEHVKDMTGLLDGLVKEAQHLGGLLGPMFGGNAPVKAA